MNRDAEDNDTLTLAVRSHDAGRWREAETLYRKVLETDPKQPAALNLLAMLCFRKGEKREAVGLLTKAVIIKPDFAEAHGNLGNVFLDMGQPGKAMTCYRDALACRPDYPEAHYNLATALSSLGLLDDAIGHFQTALQIRPDYLNAYYNLCELLDRTNRIEELRALLARAKAHCPGSPAIALREAQLFKRDGDFAAARALLKPLTEADGDAPFQTARAYLLGDLCDRLGDHDAAFGHFAEANRRSALAALAMGMDKAGSTARIGILQNRFTPDWIAGWSPLPPDDSRPAPVFLVGFPRSGTTLLDSILRGHPDIAMIEEMPTVQRMERALAAMPGGYPNGLAGLTAERQSALRQAFFTEADKHLGDNAAATVLIDRMPLNTVEAGLIHRVFPDARFLFALRHPCDCVLSCFMQDFQPTDASINFHTLEDAARLYDMTMTLWRHYCDVLPLQVHSVRYEDLIGDFEGTLRPLLSFLDLDWDDNMRRHAETAKARTVIRTASYEQVTQPLYTRARDRWRRYGKHFEPELPFLELWIERFGYET